MIKEEEEQQKGSVKKVKRSLEERREGDGGRHKRKRGSEMGSGSHCQPHHFRSSSFSLHIAVGRGVGRKNPMQR